VKEDNSFLLYPSNAGKHFFTGRSLFRMTTFAIGVDLGGTNLRIAAVDESGKILDRVTTGTAVAAGRDGVIDDMCQAVQAVQTKLPASQLMGIGIGVPGIIDLHTGMLRQSPNLPGWDNYPVQQEIERRLGAKVFLENDANAAALGEQWRGAASGFESSCMITLGTGVGGGLVLDGRIFHGMLGMAGELGHINVEPDGAPCGCGSRGCLEQYASATAIKRMATESAKSGHAPRLAQAIKEDPNFNSAKVYELAMSGDAPAREVFCRVGTALGIALADLINIFNLPVYVIGGGAAAAWDAFAPTLFDVVGKYSYIYRVTSSPEGPLMASTSPDTQRGSSSANVTRITRASLGGDAGLIGAARLPISAAPASGKQFLSKP
jgi:glucokinase